MMTFFNFKWDVVVALIAYNKYGMSTNKLSTSTYIIFITICDYAFCKKFKNND